MRPAFPALYSPREIARAAGVAELDVRAMLEETGPHIYVPHDEAVRIGRVLAGLARGSGTGGAHPPLFAAVTGKAASRKRLMPFALSSSLHAGLAAALVVVAGLNIAPRAAALRTDERPNELMRMVFLRT